MAYMSCIPFWALLVSFSATVFEAKPIEHRHRHMRDIVTGKQSEDTKKVVFQQSVPIRHNASRRHEPSNRKRRGFQAWSGDQDDSIKLRVRKTPAYLYNRSFFVPVYGDEHIPKYVRALPYDTKANNIFPHFDEMDDPRPKWGNLQTDSSTRRPKKPKKYILRPIPTRQSKLKTTTETVPFVQQIRGVKIPLNAIYDTMDFSESVSVGTSTVQPQKVLRVQVTKTTTALATPTSTTQMNLSNPSNCAWAVVSCCSASSTEVPESCFEARGCPGPFWDRSPCESDFAKAAIKRALEYYN